MQYWKKVPGQYGVEQGDRPREKFPSFPLNRVKGGQSLAPATPIRVHPVLGLCSRRWRTLKCESCLRGVSTLAWRSRSV